MRSEEKIGNRASKLYYNNPAGNCTPFFPPQFRKQRNKGLSSEMGRILLKNWQTCRIFFSWQPVEVPSHWLELEVFYIQISWNASFPVKVFVNELFMLPRWAKIVTDLLTISNEVYWLVDVCEIWIKFRCTAILKRKLANIIFLVLFVYE